MAIDKAMRDEVQAYISKDDVSGEDPEVRRVAINALGNHAGTVVVMDPMTGRVYSMVNQEWALRRGFKPCSTIKLVTGVAGLSENAIPQVDTVDALTRPAITEQAAAAVVKHYNEGSSAADRRRSMELIAGFESGDLLRQTEAASWD